MLTNPNRIGEERKDGQGCHLSCSTTTAPQTRGKWLGLKIFVHLFLGNVVCHLWIKGPLWPSPVCDIGARTHPQNEQWPLLNVESRRKPVTPNNCHILLWPVIGRTAGSPSPSTGDEVAVTGLKRPCLVCQQRGAGSLCSCWGQAAGAAGGSSRPLPASGFDFLEGRWSYSSVLPDSAGQKQVQRYPWLSVAPPPSATLFRGICFQFSQFEKTGRQDG